MELELSKSPRSTWVWAPDVDEAERLRVILTEARCSVYPSSGRNSEPRILDLDIGVDALEGLTTLAKAGYSFRWHESVSPLNRTPVLYGASVSPAEAESAQ